MAGKRTKKLSVSAVQPAPLPIANAVKSKSYFSPGFILALLLGIISVIVYANTLSNGFVLDDHVAIQDNGLVKKGLAGISELLVTPYHRGWNIEPHDNLYRPLSLVMFAMEYQVFELNPAPYHLFNILVFAGCVILLFRFLDTLFEKKKTGVAFIASLLFALHPIHTEVVANIKSRDELLSFFFAFLCLNLFLKYSQSGRWLSLLTGSFCFLLSLLSKETAITFCVVIPIIFFFYSNEHKRLSARICLSTAAVAVIFLVGRFLVIRYYQVSDVHQIDLIENALANPNLSSESRLATAIFILGYYIRLLLAPYPLLCDYSYNSIPYVHFSNPFVLLSLLVYISLGAFAIIRLLKKHKGPYAFGVLFFLITLLLFSNIFFLLDATMAERFLFFGSAGFCLVVALLMEQMAGKVAGAGITILKNPKVWGVIVPLSVVYAIITINRNGDWSDNYRLYTTDLEKASNDSRLNYYVADFLYAHLPDRTDIAKRTETRDYAVSLLNKATQINPDYTIAYYDLGSFYFVFNNFDSAELNYKKALTLSPQAVMIIIDLAHLYFAAKKYDQAIEYNKKAIALNPGYAVTYANVGLCFLSSRQYDSAISYANKAASLDPRFNGSYEVLANAYKAMGNADSSGKYSAFTQGARP